MAARGEQYARQIDLFDGTNALFTRAVSHGGIRGEYLFVASEAVNNFLIGGPNITVTADLDYVEDAQLACTISGDIP